MLRLLNIAMVYTYFEIGRMIIEERTKNNRAEYGKYIIRNLSSFLTERYGKGYSVDNLKLMRRFYTIYKTDSIGETVFPQLKTTPSPLQDVNFT